MLFDREMDAATVGPLFFTFLPDPSPFPLTQIEELEEAAPSWIERLDVYMDVEKGAWRETAAIDRQEVTESSPHQRAVAEMRNGLAVA